MNPQTDTQAELRMARMIWRMRSVGLVLMGLAVAVVLYEQQSSPARWALLLVNALLWPPLALMLSLRAASPSRAEFRNLLVDSAMGGIWIALIGFNVLPSALIVAMLGMDRVGLGGLPLLLRALTVQATACLVAVLLFAGPFSFNSSMPVVLGCLPLLLVYPAMISTVSHRLSRRVRRQNRLLAEMSRLDTLTGLPNRQHFDQVLAQEFNRFQRSGHPVCLAVLDLDDFKSVNDNHGHGAGDDLLRRVGTLMLAGLRTTDTPARYGGDEFAVVLPDTTEAAAQLLLERIGQRLHEHGAGSDGARSSLSIGIAQLRQGMISAQSWIEAADAAMYRAKARGRNRVEVALPP